MNTIDKIIFAAFALCIVVGGCCYYRLMGKVFRLQGEKARLETQLEECKGDVRDVRAAVARQNAAIEAVRVDTVEVKTKMQSIEREFAETRAFVGQRSAKDTSCETMLANIDYVMRVFHGVRPEDRNAD